MSDFNKPNMTERELLSRLIAIQTQCFAANSMSDFSHIATSIEKLIKERWSSGTPRTEPTIAYGYYCNKCSDYHDSVGECPYA